MLWGARSKLKPSLPSSVTDTGSIRSVRFSAATARLPSVFSKAVVSASAVQLEVPSRTAPGRMNRLSWPM